jgi:hypothetical protein
MKTDRYAWTGETARAVRAGDFAHVDRDLLAEELEQMGRSERRELKALAQRIIEHVIKVEHLGGLDGGRYTRHWRAEIVGFQQQLADLIEESPSLKAELTRKLLDATYQKALERLRLEYGDEPFRTAPPRCPFDLDAFL